MKERMPLVADVGAHWTRAMDEVSKLIAEMVACVGQQLGLGRAVLIPRGPGAAATASSLAHQLGLPLDRIDLAAVSRASVDDTARNLDAVFEQAEKGGAILFLDEADALLSRRTELADSHDRYAQRAALLTSRIAVFNGVAIVAGSEAVASALGSRNVLRFGVQLPDLSGLVDVEIIRENLSAIQAIYFAYALEETRMIAVVDRIVSLFASGLLPLGAGHASNDLMKMWSQRGEQLSDEDRRIIYSRVFGAPGGDADVTPNRDFQDLWLRFVSAVAAGSRQGSPGGRARDLAVNLSAHGYGMARFVADDLRAQVRTATALLSDPAVTAAFGAHDMWQVIEKVSANDLGGARNTRRFVEMAESGANIIGWLAKHATTFDHGQWMGDDAQLTAACERWLAAQDEGDGDVPHRVA